MHGVQGGALVIFFSGLGGWIRSVYRAELSRFRVGSLLFVYLLCHGLLGALSSTCFVTDFRVWGSLFGMPRRDPALCTCLCRVFSGASVDRCRCETGSPMKWLRSLSVRCSLLARCRVEQSRESELFMHVAAVCATHFLKQVECQGIA